MPRFMLQTLTEQMFYVLLCLKEECYGLEIFDRIERMTGGRVRIGSGTLYNLLEQFLGAGLIREVRVDGRRRSYILTYAGEQKLRRETERLQAQIDDYKAVFGKEKGI